MPRFAASDLVLHCFLMSHKKDARLIWVNVAASLHVLKHVINVIKVSRQLSPTAVLSVCDDL